MHFSRYIDVLHSPQHSIQDHIKFTQVIVCLRREKQVTHISKYGSNIDLTIIRAVNSVMVGRTLFNNKSL